MARGGTSGDGEGTTEGGVLTEPISPPVHGSAWQPGSQLSPSPGAKPAGPQRSVVKRFVEHPAGDFLGVHWQEATRFDGLIVPLGLETIDDDLLAVEPPDLRYSQCRIDPSPVNPGGERSTSMAKSGLGYSATTPD